MEPGWDLLSKSPIESRVGSLKARFVLQKESYAPLSLWRSSLRHNPQIATDAERHLRHNGIFYYVRAGVGLGTN
jgi:hypothetical protein